MRYRRPAYPVPTFIAHRPTVRLHPPPATYRRLLTTTGRWLKVVVHLNVVAVFKRFTQGFVGSHYALIL